MAIKKNLHRKLVRVFWLLTTLCSFYISIHTPMAAGQDFHASLNNTEATYLATHKTIKVGNQLDWPPFDFEEQGEPHGYSVDYLNLLAKKSGLKLEYVNGYTWAELKKMFRNGQIDVLPAVFKNAERETFVAFSDPYLTISDVLVTRAGSTERSLSDLRGKRVALVTGDGRNRKLLAEHPYVQPVWVKNPIEALKAVSLGDADGYAESQPIFSYLIEKHFITNLKIAGSVTLENEVDRHLYFGVQKSQPELISVLNKAMTMVSEEETKHIGSRFGQGFSETLPKVELGLTKEESQYLKTLKEVVFCADPDWMPYERIHDGIHEGMTADLIKMAGERIGLQFRLHETTTWQQTLEDLRTGQCDITTAAASTESRREWLEFTRPYIEFPLVVAVRSEQLFIEDFSDIRDQPIGVVKGYAHIDLLREEYPGLLLHQVNNIGEGLRKVQTGELFGFIDSVATIGYAIRQNDILDLKIGGKSDIPIKLTVALRKETDPLLLSILDKTFASYSEQEKKAVYDKWFSVTFEQGIDYSLVWQVIFAGGVIIFIFVIWNRTIARSETKVRKSEAQFRSLVETSQTVPFSIDLTTCRYTYIGSQIEKWLGYELASWSDIDHWAEYIHSNDRASTLKIRKQNQTQATDYKLEYRMISASGDIVWIREFVSVVANENGTLSLRGFMFDVTTEKKREEDLNQAKEDAVAASIAKSRFLANMSHELRTPLNAILGFSELMESQVSDQKHKDHLNAILTGGRGLLTLLNDILDLSKIESDKMVIHQAPVSIKELINEIPTVFSLNFSESKLRIIQKIDADIPPALSLDATRIRQVLFNLVGNSIKFTETGHIKVSASIQNPSHTNRTVDLVLKVEDTGIGIPESEQSRIFGAFEQVTYQDDEKHSGTGLGLAICKRLTEAMNGTLTVESTLGTGSVFQVALPNVELASSEGMPKAYNKLNDETDKSDYLHLLESAKGRILVVDDTPSNRELISEFLQNTPFTLHNASNGHEALLMAKKYQPDLILMDLKMPVMDGYEATRTLKDDPDLKHIPVISLSAATVENENTLKKQYGFDSVIKKPVQMKELLQALCDFFDHESICFKAELQSLPSTWKTAMKTAIEHVDIKEMNHLVSQLQQESKDLADQVQQKIEQFEYSIILEWMGVE